MTTEHTYKKILVPVDFSNTSKKTLERALELQMKYGAKLIVATFVAPVNNVANLYNISFVDIETKMLEEAKKNMADFCEAYDVASEDAIVDVGHPKHAILELVDAENFDLIVMGSHGHHGLLDTVLGSTANAIVSHAKCDVMIVRS